MELQQVGLDQLREHPQNPRSHFDEFQLKELRDSILEKGILNPLLVRPNGKKGFQILAGARRFRAAQLAGLAEVPVLVRELDDDAAFELMLVDNLQRNDIHPLDEARGYSVLLEKGYDVAKLSEKVGRSVKYVYDRVKLLSLTEEAGAPLAENIPGHDRNASILPGWFILELMGHRRLAGYVTEQTIAGAGFLRIDVPGVDGATQLYPPSSVYCMTPTTESLARAIAANAAPAPVHPWELRRSIAEGGTYPEEQ